MVRSLRPALLVVLAGCLCQRCPNGSSFTKDVPIDLELGSVDAACSGVDRVETDNGTFDATYAVEMASDGTELCTVAVAWTGGTLIDMAEVAAEARRELANSEEKAAESIGILIEKLDFTQIVGLDLADPTGIAVLDPAASELHLVLVDPAQPVDSDAVFDLPAGGAVVFEFDKLRGAPATGALDLPPYGPAQGADYERDGTWPYLDRANDALDAEQPLPVSGRVVVKVPLADMAGFDIPADLGLGLDTELVLSIGLYSCVF